jgi:hypothetical protein
MLQRTTTVPEVIEMLTEKLHLEAGHDQVHLILEVNAGLAKRLLGSDVQPSALVLKWKVPVCLF